jgi:stage III sporulation protein AB
MVIKIIGAVVILGSTSIIGFSLARDCSKRPGILRELQAALQMLENEICYMSNLLSDAFMRIYKASNTDAAILFKDAADRLNLLGTTAYEAWETAVNDQYARLSLKKEDKAILLNFGKMLGNSDLDGQISNIRLTASQLKLQELKAEETRKKNEKMYRSLGVLGGLALIIILF